MARRWAELSRATVTQIFQGEVEGKSAAELLMCQAPDDSAGGYIVPKRVAGPSCADTESPCVLRRAGKTLHFGLSRD